MDLVATAMYIPANCIREMSCWLRSAPRPTQISPCSVMSQSDYLNSWGTAEGDQGADEQVSLAHRALPLIELLEAAQREHATVMWDNQ